MRGMIATGLYLTGATAAVASTAAAAIPEGATPEGMSTMGITAILAALGWQLLSILKSFHDSMRVGQLKIIVEHKADGIETVTITKEGDPEGDDDLPAITGFGGRR